MFRRNFFKAILFMLLPIIVFSACSNNTVNNEITAEKVISDFFDFYSQGEHVKMRKLTTEEFSEIFLTDLENGIFGMKNAKLLECEYDSNYLNGANSAEDGILVFRCKLEITPSEISVYSDTETEATFLLEVRKQDNKWKITDYFNG